MKDAGQVLREQVVPIRHKELHAVLCGYLAAPLAPTLPYTERCPADLQDCILEMVEIQRTAVVVGKVIRAAFPVPVIPEEELIRRQCAQRLGVYVDPVMEMEHLVAIFCQQTRLTCSVDEATGTYHFTPLLTFRSAPSPFKGYMKP